MAVVLRRPEDFVSSSLRNLQSPQREAVTGKRLFLPQEELVEGLAESYLPVRARAQFEREQIEAAQKLERRNRRLANIDVAASTGINLARLGAETDVFGKAKGFFGGNEVTAAKVSSGTGRSVLPTTYTDVFPGGIKDEVASGLGVGTPTASTGIGISLARAGLNVLPGIGGAVASKQFSDYDRRSGFSRKIGKKLGVGKQDVSNVGKIVSGAAGGAATGSIVPGVGTLAGGLIGATAGLLDVVF